MKPTPIKQFVFVAVILSVFKFIPAQKKTLPDSLSLEQKMINHFQISNEFIDRKGDIPKALHEFNKGYKLATTIGTDSVMAIAGMYKAIIDYNKENFDLALPTLKKSLSYFKSIDKNHILISKIYNHLGILYYKKNEKHKTEKYFELAYQQIVSSKANILLGLTSIFNLAEIYYKNKKYKLAKERMEFVKNHYYNYMVNTKKLDLTHSITYHKMCTHIALCNLQLGKKNNVFNMLNKSFKCFRVKKYYNGLQIYFQYLKDYEISQNNYKQASIYSDSILKYSDLQFQNWKAKNETYIKDSENFENMTLQLELSEKEKELAQQKNTYLLWILSIATGVILSLFIISIVLKKKNKTLKILKIQAEQGERQKSKFIAMISHEIRTPLNALLGFSKLLLDESPKKHQKKHLNALVSSANYLLNLVTNVLNLNHTESSFLKIENHTINMVNFIDSITNDFSLQLSNNNNNLNVNFDPKIPKYLKSDSIKITQILKNLLNNACKFTTYGQIWLNITLFEDNSDHCMISFEVKDTGIGISKEKFDVIFEAFSNDRLDIKKDYDGSGIGLTIVQKLLNVFDSEIIIESTTNQGSSFSFVIKLNKIAKEVKATNSTNKNAILNNKNVLVVEDNKINQLLASKMLKKVKANPTISSNGLIGFETFKSKPEGYFDFVLMDIHMPIMDGYESTKLIKSISPNTPIVALTATNLKNTSKILQEKQLDAVIYKPYEVEHVYNIIIDILTKTL